MTVDEGMDVARARQIAMQLRHEADRLTDVSAAGTAQMGVLDEAWAGHDANGFRQQWVTAERLVHDCTGHLTRFAGALSRQAADQEGASSAGPGTAPPTSGARPDADGGSGPKRKADPEAGPDTQPAERIEGPLFTGPEGGQVRATDVEQGSLADCWFITSLQSVAAANPQVIEDNVVDNGDGTYTVTLYADGEPVEYVVTPEFPADDGDPQYADNPGQRELWPLLYEKAMAQHMGGSWEDMNVDTAERGFEAITGQDADTEGTGDFLGFFGPPTPDEIGETLANDGQVALSSYDEVGDRPEYQGEDGIVTNHIYWVKEVRDDGTLVIINPYDASETALEMSYEQYRENFSHITTSEP